MVYHPGKIVALFPKKGKDDDTQAMIEFWDENISTVRMDRRIETAVKEGDMVRIVEGRPLSKNKRWVLKEIVRVAPIAGAGPVNA